MARDQMARETFVRETNNIPYSAGMGFSLSMIVMRILLMRCTGDTGPR